MPVFGFSPKLQCQIQAVRPGGSVRFCRMLLTFLYIGAIGFGGGMAIVALMEEAFVRRHRVISSEEFLHGVGLGQVLGPFSVNTAMFTGYRLFGPLGAVSAGTVFMAPSIVLVLALSWLYFTYHTIPALKAAMAGLAPVVIALILSAAWSMGAKAVRRWPAALLMAASVFAALQKVNAVYVLLGAGLIGLLIGKKNLAREDVASKPPAPPQAGEQAAATQGLLWFAAGGAPAAASGVTISALCLGFLKVGLIFFGGGFVLIPVLHQHLVTQHAWLTSQEFLDGLAISNLTPGPITVLATFAGYRLKGILGGLAATVALYTPSCLLMLLLSHGYAHFQGSRRTQDFLAGIGPATVGLVASAGIILGWGALGSWRAYAAATVSLFLLGYLKSPPLVVLALGVALGLLRFVP